MKRLLTAGACLLVGLWLGGCSTVQGDFHQKLQIDAVDARNRPVEGMQCQIGSGSSAKTFVTPATDVRVRRAMMPLNIECRRDNLVATATVKSRRERMEEALLPFGSVGVFVDHMSGSLYAYPTALHLRVGQHVVLEHGGEARIAEAEPIAPPPAAAAAPAQRIELAALQPTAIARSASADTAAPAPPKTAAGAPKTNRAVAKPVKTASSASTASKPRAAPPATATVATARSAPVNW